MSSEISQDLLDEVTSLNSIYSPTTVTLHEPPTALPEGVELGEGEAVCTLSPPGSEINPPVSLILKFPKTYPASPPTIVSGTTYGKGLSKEQVTQLSRDVLHDVWLQDAVVLFELVEGLKELLNSETSAAAETSAGSDDHDHDHIVLGSTSAKLISTDRKVSKATHNITAYRIRTAEGLIYQDNDDDGETAAGSRLGHLLELIDVWNVVVVVSRWYGGIKLGPDRFRIINQVAREALVLGGFVEEHHDSSEAGVAGKKKKKGKHH
ncbi:hypothetical protein AA313_de0204295 [Arthrobotrys entomopaga]|nr:hypothetical protein AA313_de0204295 [Arthrobotrys entomopaga]